MRIKDIPLISLMDISNPNLMPIKLKDYLPLILIDSLCLRTMDSKLDNLRLSKDMLQENVGYMVKMNKKLPKLTLLPYTFKTLRIYIKKLKLELLKKKNYGLMKNLFPLPKVLIPKSEINSLLDPKFPLPVFVFMPSTLNSLITKKLLIPL